MDSEPGNLSQLVATAKRMGKRILIAGENRAELLMVEIQEAREGLLRAIMLALGVAAFALLGFIALTMAIAILLWQHSPAIALIVLAVIYGSVSFFLYRRFLRIQRDWQTLPGTLEQLRKDCQCLERNLD